MLEETTEALEIELTKGKRSFINSFVKSTVEITEKNGFTLIDFLEGLADLTSDRSKIEDSESLRLATKKIEEAIKLIESSN
jgi:hypothetical protein